MQQFYELVRELVGLGKDVTEVTLRKAGVALQKYFSFLRRISVSFLLFLTFTLVLFILGVVYELKPVVSLATFLGGTAVFLWLLAAFPVVWAVTKGFEWGPMKKVFEWIGVATLWIFFLSVYFYLVPVPLAGIPVVLLLTAAMAIASVVFGVGISTRFIALRLGIVFTVMTVSFVLTTLFPSSSSGLGKLVAWVDEKTSGVIEEVTVPLPKPVAYHQGLAFFDPRTQKPLIWYFRNESGDYDLFDAGGFHPQYGAKLEPVTLDKVKEFNKLFQERMAKIEEAAKIEAERLATEKRIEEKRLTDLKAAIEEARVRKDAQVKANEAVKAIAETPPSRPEPQVSPRPPVVTPKLPKPRRVLYLVIRAGTSLEVALNQSLSTETSKVGETFLASLSQAIEAGDGTLPPGTVFEGRINQLGRPGRLQGVAFLDLILTSFSFNDNFVSIRTDATRREGTAETTVLGATWGQDLVLPPETILEFRLAKDIRTSMVQ